MNFKFLNSEYEAAVALTMKMCDIPIPFSVADESDIIVTRLFKTIWSYAFSALNVPASLITSPVFAFLTASRISENVPP